MENNLIGKCIIAILLFVFYSSTVFAQTNISSESVISTNITASNYLIGTTGLCIGDTCRTSWESYNSSYVQIGGDLSGTVTAPTVVNTQGLNWGNLTSWSLNNAWTGSLGWGNLTPNMTITGTLANFSTLDTIIYLNGNASLLGGSPASGGINIIQTIPEAKDGIWWNAYDKPSNTIQPVAWLVAHFNTSTGGTPHSHFSIETLDNTTGTPSINSHFEISYNSSQTRANVQFPTADVQFLSNQPLYFGDSKQVWLQHNGSSGDLDIHGNAKVKLFTPTGLDLNGYDILNVADIYSNSANSLDVKPTTTFRIFPNGQTNLGLVISNTSAAAKIDLSASGSDYIQSSDHIEIVGNRRLILDANTTSLICNSTFAGSIYYDGATYKHYGCNSTAWNALY